MGNGNRTRTAFRLGDLFLLRTPGFAQMLALGYLWETETNGCRAVGVAEERKKMTAKATCPRLQNRD